MSLSSGRLSAKILDESYYGTVHGRAVGKLIGSASDSNFVAVVGRNGSGKSLLLRSVAGVSGYRSLSLFRGVQTGDVAYIAPDLSGALPPEVTTFEFLSAVGGERVVVAAELERTLLGKVPQPTQARASIQGLAAELGSVGHKLLGELNSGHKQRTLIAALLLQRRNCVALDELESNLDRNGRTTAFTLLHEVFRTLERRLLFATHDLTLVHRFADACLLVEPSSEHGVCSRATWLQKSDWGELDDLTKRIWS